MEWQQLVGFHHVASVEITPNRTAELNENDELIGIEILDASTYARDAIVESVQAKLLQLSEAKTA